MITKWEPPAESIFDRISTNKLVLMLVVFVRTRFRSVRICVEFSFDRDDEEDCWKEEEALGRLTGKEQLELSTISSATHPGYFRKRQQVEDIEGMYSKNSEELLRLASEKLLTLMRITDYYLARIRSILE